MPSTEQLKSQERPELQELQELHQQLQNPAIQQKLLTLARNAIYSRVCTGKKFTADDTDYPLGLRQKGCCFVTLHKQGKLRGCIGALEPYTSLIQDIANHAQAAAVDDPRFPAVSESELGQLDIEISILTPQEPLTARSEADLLNQLTPNKDGLTIDDGFHRATFLPSVWEQLPEKADFLLHLKRKAGMRDQDWPDNIRCWRYHTIMIN